MVDPLEPDRETEEPAGVHPLVVILGPTGSGKSALGIVVAERLGGEVVNYDSVQAYRGLDVGSGKVLHKARRGVPHHMIDCVDPGEVFTAGDYRRQATRALEAVRERGRLPVLVGGTGLYLRALLLGLFEGPTRSEPLRARLRALAARRGDEFLHRMLRRLDPETAARVAVRDKQKIIRTLEVCLVSRERLSAMWARSRTGLRGFRSLKIGLNPSRAELYDRINRRAERMFAEGLLDETRSLVARPDAVRIKPLEALGYRQACAYLRSEISLEEAVRTTQAATRNYAKRQMTWFRREPDVAWFQGFGDDSSVERQVLEWLAPRLSPVHVQRRAGIALESM